MIGKWPSAPDFIEPIVAYRCWGYSLAGGAAMLSSIGPGDADATDDWDGSWRRWVEASCRMLRAHVAPDEGCTCGFYALKSVDDAAIIVSFHWPRTEAFELRGVVLGRVELAGKVIEHDKGFRAERARVADLIPTTTDGGVTRRVAASLDLPVGSELDTTAMEERAAEVLGFVPPVRTKRLNPVERMRLKMHRRHFRVIQGGGEN